MKNLVVTFGRLLVILNSIEFFRFWEIFAENSKSIQTDQKCFLLGTLDNLLERPKQKI